MAKNKELKANGSFVKQAGILAAAGIVSRIIGMLYKAPVTAIIGDEGMGYYSPAYNIYAIILLISSYSIPSAISKVISQRLALKEYKNAQKMFLCAFYYVIVVGLIGSMAAYFGAEFLVAGESSAKVLKVLAPTIFFSGLLGVFRGYFQAHGTMVQTAFSQILEQVLHAIVSIVLASLMVRTALGMSDTAMAERGAMGSAVGVDVGVLAALVFMYCIYMTRRKSIRTRTAEDLTPEAELLSYPEIFKIILFMVTPIIMSTFIYNLSTSLNQTIFIRQMLAKGVEDKAVHIAYGLFANKAVTLSNIPIAIASAMSAAVLPSISGSYAQQNEAEVCAKIDKAIRTTMYISIPCAVGMTVLAKPIVYIIYPQVSTLDTSAKLLTSIGISIVFYALSTLTNAVLQAMGKVNRPVVNALAALVIQTIVLVALIQFTQIGVYGLAAAMILYSFLMCVLNNLSVRRVVAYHQEYKKTFLLPALSALVMGVIAYVVYHGLHLLFGRFLGGYMSSAAALMPAVLIGALVYFALSLKLGAMDRMELRTIPGGTHIVKLAVKLKLLK